jgi:hypothetical protein
MKSMKKAFLIGAAAVAAALSGQVQAAGSAVIESGQGSDRQQAKLEYRGDKMRVEAQANGVMILRDGKVYALAEGQVIDMSTMGNLFAGQAGGTISQGPDDLVRYLGLDSTGRSETVAGVSGIVHLLRYQDRAGKTHSEELVMSKDARARALSDALQSMANSFRAMAGVAATPGEAQLESQMKGQGVLRYGKEFRVVSFDAKAPDEERFALPAAPMQLPSLGAMPAAATAADAGEESSTGAKGGLGGLFGKVLGEKAQRQQERVEARTESEADGATDRAMDKVLDKAFGKLFGE